MTHAHQTREQRRAFFLRLNAAFDQFEVDDGVYATFEEAMEDWSPESTEDGRLFDPPYPREVEGGWVLDNYDGLDGF